MSAFAACGYAKFSGRVGICTATSGPGAIHLLNGLYDAKLEHVGVVAIVGQTARSAMGGAYQQEVDLLTLFKDVANEYCQMVSVPEQLPNVLDRAIRIASSRRTVTAVIIPSDVQELEYVPPSHEFKMVRPAWRPGSLQSRPKQTLSVRPSYSMPAPKSPCSSARVREEPPRKLRGWPIFSARAWQRRCLARF
jgi:thiamine pyrophosphate-dependent acetolactate synthase large subunit-like protein